MTRLLNTPRIDKLCLECAGHGYVPIGNGEQFEDVVPCYSCSGDVEDFAMEQEADIAAQLGAAHDAIRRVKYACLKAITHLDNTSHMFAGIPADIVATIKADLYRAIDEPEPEDRWTVSEKRCPF